MLPASHRKSVSFLAHKGVLQEVPVSVLAEISLLQPVQTVLHPSIRCGLAPFQKNHSLPLNVGSNF